MSETTTPLICVRREYRCDECGTGKMLPTGYTLTSFPPQYPHSCDSCGAYQVLGRCYPLVEFVEETLDA